jgi:acylphosphatase
MIRRTIYYEGRVQGVGFRFTTRQIARNYDVTGYVRNLPDGRVELVVEGERDEVDAMTEELASAMSGYIRNATSDQSSATGQFNEFSVRH